MSGLVAPIPAEDFVLPVAASRIEHADGARTSIESSASQRLLNRDISSDKKGPWATWRHTIGIGLLLATVFLWTASNFLASTIFADDSYSKPYFVTYVNSSFFSTLLILVFIKRLWASGGSMQEAVQGQDQSALYVPVPEEEREALVKSDDQGEARAEIGSPRSRLLIEEPVSTSAVTEQAAETRLTIRETAWLSLEFCILWVNTVES
ncbi:hypothetical protein ACLMJK_000677 [Lecanora helva]